MELSDENYEILLEILMNLKIRYLDKIDNLYEEERLREMLDWNDHLLEPLEFNPADRIYELKDNKIVSLNTHGYLPATSISESMFSRLPDLEKLFLTIEVAEVPCFLRGDNLQFLILELNKCKSIPKNLFNELSNLKILDFSTDFLDLSDILFSNLNLDELRFRYKSEFPSTIFDSQELSKLSLYLDSKTLSPELFTEQNNLKILDIQASHLEYLPENIFDNLRMLERLTIKTQKELIMNENHFEPLQNLKIINLYKPIKYPDDVKERCSTYIR